MDLKAKFCLRGPCPILDDFSHLFAPIDGPHFQQKSRYD